MVDKRYLKRYNDVEIRQSGKIINKGRVMLGGYIHDLEKGDVFKPIRYELTAFMVSEYAHSLEQDYEFFHSKFGTGKRQIRPPTMIHADKMRILEENCTKERRLAGQAAPDWRIHFEYHAKHHSVAYVGETIVVTGHITDKYLKRGRQYLCYFLEAKTSDGRLITTYRDQTVLRYKLEGTA
jgi:hypothetical protein